VLVWASKRARFSADQTALARHAKHVLDEQVSQQFALVRTSAVSAAPFIRSLPIILGLPTIRVNPKLWQFRD
jgi:hypothetical protein